jgi:hypothetical protein
MKFGKSLLTLCHAPWADHYLAYKELKKTLKRQVAGDAQNNSLVEGAFVTELLQSVHAVNGFFTRMEQEIAARLAALVSQLEKPASWVTRTVAVSSTTEEVSLGSIAATLEVGTHLDQAHSEALGAFVALCADIDALRKYSMLNYLAVTKIVKKHDKQSALRLREGIINFVASQPFYTSTQLARTFTHAQCLASEIIVAATSASILSQVLPSPRSSPTLLRRHPASPAARSRSPPRLLLRPQSADYKCCICLEVLNMPVVLSCAHRFCYSCLAKSCLYDNHCPLCKKETDLDPANYHVRRHAQFCAELQFSPSSFPPPTRSPHPPVPPSPLRSIPSSPSSSTLTSPAPTPTPTAACRRRRRYRATPPPAATRPRRRASSSSARRASFRVRRSPPAASRAPARPTAAHRRRPAPHRAPPPSRRRSLRWP